MKGLLLLMKRLNDLMSVIRNRMIFLVWHRWSKYKIAWRQEKRICYFAKHWPLWNDIVSWHQQKKAMQTEVRRQANVKRVNRHLMRWLDYHEMKRYRGQQKLTASHFRFIKVASRVFVVWRSETLDARASKHWLGRFLRGWKVFVQQKKKLREWQLEIRYRFLLSLEKAALLYLRKYYEYRQMIQAYGLARIKESPAKILPFAFLLRGNPVQYTFCKAFMYWAHTAKRRIVYENFLYIHYVRRRRALLKYAFDALRGRGNQVIEDYRYTWHDIGDVVREADSTLRLIKSGNVHEIHDKNINESILALEQRGVDVSSLTAINPSFRRRLFRRGALKHMVSWTGDNVLWLKIVGLFLMHTKRVIDDGDFNQRMMSKRADAIMYFKTKGMLEYTKFREFYHKVVGEFPNTNLENRKRLARDARTTTSGMFTPAPVRSARYSPQSNPRYIMIDRVKNTRIPRHQKRYSIYSSSDEDTPASPRFTVGASTSEGKANGSEDTSSSGSESEGSLEKSSLNLKYLLAKQKSYKTDSKMFVGEADDQPGRRLSWMNFIVFGFSSTTSRASHHGNADYVNLLFKPEYENPLFKYEEKYDSIYTNSPIHKYLATDDPYQSENRRMSVADRRRPNTSRTGLNPQQDTRNVRSLSIFALQPPTEPFEEREKHVLPEPTPIAVPKHPAMNKRVAALLAQRAPKAIPQLSLTPQMPEENQESSAIDTSHSGSKTTPAPPPKIAEVIDFESVMRFQTIIDHIQSIYWNTNTEFDEPVESVEDESIALRRKSSQPNAIVLPNLLARKSHRKGADKGKQKNQVAWQKLKGVIKRFVETEKKDSMQHLQLMRELELARPDEMPQVRDIKSIDDMVEALKVAKYVKRAPMYYQSTNDDIVRKTFEGIIKTSKREVISSLYEMAATVTDNDELIDQNRELYQKFVHRIGGLDLQEEYPFAVPKQGYDPKEFEYPEGDETEQEKKEKQLSFVFDEAVQSLKSRNVKFDDIAKAMFTSKESTKKKTDILVSLATFERELILNENRNDEYTHRPYIDFELPADIPIDSENHELGDGMMVPISTPEYTEANENVQNVARYHTRKIRITPIDIYDLMAKKGMLTTNGLVVKSFDFAETFRLPQIQENSAKAKKALPKKTQSRLSPSPASILSEASKFVDGLELKGKSSGPADLHIPRPKLSSEIGKTPTVAPIHPLRSESPLFRVVEGSSYTRTTHEKTEAPLRLETPTESLMSPDHMLHPTKPKLLIAPSPTQERLETPEMTSTHHSRNLSTASGLDLNPYTDEVSQVEARQSTPLSHEEHMQAMLLQSTSRENAVNGRYSASTALRGCQEQDGLFSGDFRTEGTDGFDGRAEYDGDVEENADEEQDYDGGVDGYERDSVNGRDEY
eukprot:TRINITY_DN6613_c0_g1_i6.p1 TRINITY_DN6613_c0_g1~~TRINITY_DN6613_c0_g1_i6.p1  ORF type:complete len:1381 (-),score=292.52 TRINITY_DN6613_c0_g1_i6:371-4513(-)